MQFKVPQNIDMQDRILGPLTLFQLLYLLIGFLVSYSFLKSGSIIGFVLIGVPVGILSLALAFIKINDQPFSRFVASSIMFAIKPKIRLWHKGGTAPKVTVSANTQGNQTVVTPKQLDQRKLTEIAAKLDQP